MSAIAELIIKILMMLSLGFFLKKKSVITAELQQGLSNLLLKAILPISILASANADSIQGADRNLIYVAVIAGCYYLGSIIISLLISKTLKLEKPGKKVFVTMAVFANTAFVGFPLIAQLYGDEGSLYAVIYNLFYQLFFFTYGVSLLSSGRRIEFKALYTNVVTIASLASIALFLSPFRLPSVLADTFSMVGSMTVPLSMILIGSSLADIRFSSVFSDKYSYLVSALRLIIFPAAVALALKGVNLPHIVKATCVMMTALPSGSLNAIYAERYNCERDYAVKTVVQTMLLMVVTIPIVILVIDFAL